MPGKSPSKLILSSVGRNRMAQRHGLDSPDRIEQFVKRYAMWVHRCVGINASAAASVPFRLYSTRANGIVKGVKGPWRQPDKRHQQWLKRGSYGTVAKGMVRGLEADLTEIETHDALDFLQEINGWSNGYEWREGLYSDLQITGRHFSHVVEDGERPVELWRMYPHRMNVIPSATEFVSHFEYGQGSDKVDFSRDEVFWVKLFDPANFWGGIGWVEAWLRTIDASLAIQAFQDELFQKHGQPDFIFRTAKAPTKEQKQAFSSEWSRLFGKFWSRVRNVAFVAGVDEIDRLSDSPRELEFNVSEANKRDQIANAAGVPKPLVTSDDVNKANAREALVMHAKFGYWPLCQRVEDAINEQLIIRFGEGLVLIHDNPIPEDQEEMRADRESKLASGWSVNRLLEDEGEETLPDEWADVPLVKTGLSPLERVANAPDPMEMAQMQIDARAQQGPAGQQKPQDGPQAAQKKELTAGAPENPGGDTREDGPYTLALASAMDDAVARVVADLVSSGEPKAIRPSGPRDPDEFLTESLLEFIRKAFEGISDEHITEAVQAAGIDGVKQTPIDVAFDVTNPRVLDYVKNADRRIGRELTDSFRKAIRAQLEAGLAEGDSSVQIAERIQEAMGPEFTKGYAARISRTEMAFAHIKGTELGWQQSGAVIGKQFVLAPDACPWCKAVAEQLGDGLGDYDASKTFALGAPFFALGSVLKAHFDLADGESVEKTMTFNYAPDDRQPVVPPVHPHCRCSIRPVFDE